MLDNIPQDIAMAWAIMAVCSTFVFFFLAKRIPLVRCPHCGKRGPFRAERCLNCGNTLRW